MSIQVLTGSFQGSFLQPWAMASQFVHRYLWFVLCIPRRRRKSLPSRVYTSYLYASLGEYRSLEKTKNEIRLGNRKAAAHVAVRPSVLVTVKH